MGDKITITTEKVDEIQQVQRWILRKGNIQGKESTIGSSGKGTKPPKDVVKLAYEEGKFSEHDESVAEEEIKDVAEEMQIMINMQAEAYENITLGLV